MSKVYTSVYQEYILSYLKSIYFLFQKYILFSSSKALAKTFECANHFIRMNDSFDICQMNRGSEWNGCCIRM